MDSIKVVKAGQLTKGASTPGIERSKALDKVIISTSTIGGGNVSDWHHYGERDLYGYMVSGTLRLDYGIGGKESVQLGPGDYFHIPAGVVHRDVNPGRSPAVVIAFLMCAGPSVVNVPGP